MPSATAFATTTLPDGADLQARPRARSTTIDLIKGLAIVLVVIGHYYPPDSPAWWTTLHNLIYAFHMPVFFFAAGYTWHMRAQEGYGGYLTRKLRRLLLPCASVIALYLPVKLAASMLIDLGHPVNLTTLAKVVTDPTHSFLPFVWFFYVLFVLCAVFPIVHRGGPRAVWLSLGPAAALYLLSENYYIVMASMGYLFFTAGALLTRHFHLDLDRHIPRRALEWTLACGVVFVLITLLWKQGYGWSAQPRSLIVSLLGTTAAVLCCQGIAVAHYRDHGDNGLRYRPVILGSLTWIGASSMTICLFHTLFAGTAQAGLHRLPLLAGLPFAVNALLCILAGLLLPLALEWAVLGRVKILRILFLGEMGKTPMLRRFHPATAWARLKALRGVPARLQARRL